MRPNDTGPRLCECCGARLAVCAQCGRLYPINTITRYQTWRCCSKRCAYERRSARILAAAEGRFWAKVDKSAGPDGCWLWTGTLAGNGYGRSRLALRFGPTLYAHRASYGLAHGSIPEGMGVLHHCDNRRCVNPAHLYAGTAAQNTQDMVARGRARFWGQPAKHGATSLP